MSQEWKRLTLAGVVATALLGIFVAIGNLPVRTGCGYYGMCPKAEPEAAPTKPITGSEKAR